jgi:cytochrome c-type biogenesis protein
MYPGREIGFFLALGAGLASFFSPCVLPLLPGYLSTLAGTLAAGPGEGAGFRRRLFSQALAFVAGFSLIFILLGLSASGLGRFLLANRVYLNRLGAVVITGLGLHSLGILSFPLLLKERRVNLPLPRGGIWGALLLGAAFAAGWTPCVGPILASILILAGSTGSILTGGVLLAFYAAGLAVPFLLVALFCDGILEKLHRLHPYLSHIRLGTGSVLVLMGIYLFFFR